VLYIGSDDNSAYALIANNGGAVVALSDRKHGWLLASGGYGAVYAGSDDGYVYALTA
jgi:hypothetical protein